MSSTKNPSPEGSLLIRPAVIADLAPITAIYAEAVRNGTATFELVAPDLSEMTGRFDALIAQGYPYLAASIEGHVIGYAYAGPYRLRPAYRFTVENSLYLRSDIHRRGIGTSLLQALVAESAARGYRQMIAVIGDSANLASIGVHRRCGFDLIGAHPDVGFKFGRWIDIVLMQRSLGEGASSLPPSEAPLP